MTPEQAERVLLESSRLRKRSNLLAEAFPEQRAFLESKVRMRAACCTRRAGKSFGLGLLLFKRCLEKANVTAIYVALTRESAKRIMWRDVLKEIDRKYGLGASFNESDLIVTLSNGSTICLVGGDASEAEAAKLKGIKPVLAIVDECQDFRTDLRRLCNSVLRPALVDNRGDLLLAGVPGNIKAFFHDVTTGKVAGWEVHEWSAHNNPAVRVQWAEEIADLIATNPRVVETPAFQQEYLGKWVVDATLLAYSGYTVANDVLEHPNIDEWIFILAVDFGWGDATSLVLVAFDPYDEKLYILKAAKRTKQDVTAVAEWIRSWADKFPIHVYVADTASKQVVEELKARHGIPFEAAIKTAKSEAIAQMNADLITGKILVLQPQCKALTKEWEGLIWDEKKLPLRVEHPGCENHASDSALYAWRRATNYSPLDRPRTVVAVPQTDEEMSAFEEAQDDVRERAERLEWWERDQAG
jgi:hypothetical protein